MPKHLRVIVTAGARREVVEEKKNGTVYIKVKEPAEANKANHRVRSIIAERVGVAVANVRILTGHHSKSKLLSIN